MKKLVADTSVVIKWVAFQDEEDVEKASAIFQAMRHNKLQILVSDFLYAELGNALYWSKRLDKEIYHETMEAVFTLPLTVYPTQPDMIKDVYALMKIHKLSFYDANPVAIAQKERVSLVSADEKHHKGLPNVILLREFWVRSYTDKEVDDFLALDRKETKALKKKKLLP